jgi:UDP-2,3-diacylglucosamine pyrophosphatase LpxH
VLRAPLPRERLLNALNGIDRLVLLGDTVELLEARPAEALTVATPVLNAIGARVPEIVLLPGNHDRDLVRDWVNDRTHALTADTEIPADASPALRRVVTALQPARVTVRYPGVWVTPRVYATHGHYLDQHLLPASAYGIARGLLGRMPRDGATPQEYEHRLHVTDFEGALTRPLPRVIAARLEDLLVAARRATTRGPLRDTAWIPRAWSRMLGVQMRRAALPALARVVHRLSIDADAVIFGHVHRAGPRDGDDPAEWAGPTGTPRLYNTGSWVHEPVLLNRQAPPHVYWPGGAISVDDDGTIAVHALLEDVPGAALTLHV